MCKLIIDNPNVIRSWTKENSSQLRGGENPSFSSPDVPALITHCSIEYSKEWAHEMGSKWEILVSDKFVGVKLALAIFPRPSFCFPQQTPITNSMEQAHLAEMLRISFGNNALELPAGIYATLP